jgi:acetyl esterase/lipase
MLTDDVLEKSAGAHLTLLTTYHLLKTHHTSSPLLPGGGLLLHFGCYDISMLPSAFHFSKPLIINRPIIEQFGDAFLPNTTTEQRKDPNISPYYENLEVFRGRLPSALFTCGTEDPLIDDTMVMSVKWLMSGGEAIVRIFQGAPHGFIGFPAGVLKDAGEAMEDCKVFIQERMASE